MDFYREKLLPMIDATCAAIEATPQMQDILHGTLPLERFRFQITHNYLYLTEYVRCWALALSKCQNFEEMQDIYSVLNSTMEKTVMMNRDFWAKKVGLTTDEMDAAVMAEGKRSYTSFQLARGFEGDLAHALMAVFPCNILYLHMGRHLLPQCTLAEDDMYREWIAFYVSPEYEAKCMNEMRLVNKLCENKPTAEQRRLCEVFATGCNYEVLQWQGMYHDMATWPLPQLFTMAGHEGGI